MTDAELAEIEAQGTQDGLIRRVAAELRAARAELAALKRESVFGVMRECERERTAAALLAALLRNNVNEEDLDAMTLVPFAVALADALRARLEAP